MKLSDVEVQGDNSKAIFYYIAEGRVDFRKLIKQFAREFNVRVEMKQIGARQEAGLVGGIGSCGRELCCALWRTDFETIKINQAKIQNLPANAQKLAGQCAKLKCCLMYELDSYLEAWEDFPRELLQLETDSGTYYPQKTDVLRKEILYSRSSETISQPLTLSIKRVKEINYQNKRGQKPSLTPDINLDSGEEQFSIGQSDISAYKSKKRKKTKRNKRNHRKNSRKNRP
jgi:cell fate regulator YaaT (PSP1 superfamily)